MSCACGARLSGLPDAWRTRWRTGGQAKRELPAWRPLEGNHRALEAHQIASLTNASWRTGSVLRFPVESFGYPRHHSHGDADGLLVDAVAHGVGQIATAVLSYRSRPVSQNSLDVSKFSPSLYHATATGITAGHFFSTFRGFSKNPLEQPCRKAPARSLS